MGTTIFFRLDKSHSEVKSVRTYVSSGAWDSLGEILDKSLLQIFTLLLSVKKDNILNTTPLWNWIEKSLI